MLAQARAGDEGAASDLAERVYAHLRALAHRQRQGWRGGGETLDTTALVHEAWMKVVDGGAIDFESRKHFYAVAAKSIRHILINHAERHRAQRRGGGAAHVPVDEELLVANDREAETILSVSSALEKLQQRHPGLASIVEYRYFVGLSVDEVADLTAQSPRSVKRKWQRAKAWLTVALGPDVLEGSA